MNKDEALKTIEELKEIVGRGDVLILNYKCYFGIGIFLFLIAALKLLANPIGLAAGMDPESFFRTAKTALAVVFTLFSVSYFKKEILVSSGKMKSAYQLGTALGVSIILIGGVLSFLGYRDLLLPVTMCLLGNLIGIYGIFSNPAIKYTGWSLIGIGLLSLVIQKQLQTDLFLWQVIYIAVSMMVVGFISKSEKLRFES